MRIAVRFMIADGSSDTAYLPVVGPDLNHAHLASIGKSIMGAGGFLWTEKDSITWIPAHRILGISLAS